MIIFLLIGLERKVAVKNLFVAKTNQLCLKKVYQKEVVFDTIKKKLQMVKIKEDLKHLKYLVEMQSQGNDERLQEELGKQNYY